MRIEDQPDHFQSAISHGSRDWASREGKFKLIRVVSMPTPLAPGETRTIDAYTVPAGRALYWCARCSSRNIRTYTLGQFIPLGLASDVWFEPYVFDNILLDPVIVIPAGVTIRLNITNQDIVSGHFSISSHTYEVIV